MAIKIGKPFSGIKAQAPRNYGRANQYMPAQLELDHTISRANRQYLEAIAVDGIEVQYWRRGTEGKFCTCHSSGKSDLITKQNTVSEDYNEEDIYKVRGARENGVTNKTSEAFGLTIGEMPADDDGRTNTVKEFDESWDELEKAADAEGFQHLGIDSAVLFGGERTQCGICFGTGHVNGYSLVNGRRDIFDATNSFTTELVGFTVDNQTHPFTFEAPSDTSVYVEYVYELPTYFENCEAFHVRNNTKQAGNLAVYFKRYGTADAFAPLTLEYLNSRRGLATTLILRVQPVRSSLEKIVRFTHVEIVFRFTEWPKVQMGALGESTNFGIWDSLLTAEMTLPPTFNKVDKEDVIYESKYNKLWKITDYTDFMTAKQQVCGWTANLRLVQQYEQLALLKLSREVGFELSYRELEVIQGRNVLDNDKI